MTDIEKIELAIRRAASQMPNYQARAFRLAADEIMKVSKTLGHSAEDAQTLLAYQKLQQGYE